MTTSWRRLLVIVPLAVALGFACQSLVRSAFFGASEPEGVERGASLDDLEVPPGALVATELDAPWALAFLQGDRVLVTERAGRVVLLEPRGRGSTGSAGDETGPGDAAAGGAGGGATAEPARTALLEGRGSHRVAAAWRVPGVRPGGEAGLMGIALHPDFPDPPTAFLCFTTDGDEGRENRVVRALLPSAEQDAFDELTPVVSGIPGASFHDGCRVAFGPDGYLYVTTGDAGSPARAQELSSLAGKILRVDTAGRPAPDNPFGTPVWSYGHRNPQGITWDDRGRLWSTEHGRSGLQSGMDELNLIQGGLNYGWPEIEGDETTPDMEPPELHSGPDVTWAPAGAAYLEGSIFFGALRGQALYEARIVEDGTPELRVHFFTELGRIRAVKAGPDGRLWIATNNTDGRGDPRPDDDRLIRIDPAALR